MRRHRWIALAALLLAATALLLSLGEDAPAPAARREVAYPKWFDGPDHERQQARATLALPPAAGGAPAPTPGGAGPDEPSGLRDPFLVSLPVKEGGLVVVFEANALRHSRLGERFIACLEADHPGDLAKLERESGVDPLKDLDRVAFLEDAVVLSGHFQHVRWDRLGGAPLAYGREGRVYRDGGEWIAAWRDQLIVVSSSEEGVHRAIDQLEGRAPVPPSGIDENLTYGEVYGVVPGASARRLLGGDERGIGAKLASLASRIELHVDAMQDVAAVVRVQGTDVDGLEDLAKTIGGALAVARIKAQAEDDRELADLLENAEVELGGAGFSLQLAVPADRLERWFADCERSRPARDATSAPPDAPADP